MPLTSLLPPPTSPPPTSPPQPPLFDTQRAAPACFWPDAIQTCLTWNVIITSAESASAFVKQLRPCCFCKDLSTCVKIVRTYWKVWVGKSIRQKAKRVSLYAEVARGTSKQRTPPAAPANTPGGVLGWIMWAPRVLCDLAALPQIWWPLVSMTVSFLSMWGQRRRGRGAVSVAPKQYQ